MKVSFDYDGTLSTEQGQQRARSHVDRGDDVYVTTSRPKNPEHGLWNNNDVYEDAKKVGIPEEKVRFTELEDKWKYLEDFDLHFDNDSMEVILINANTECIGVLIEYE
jgi:hypothetical protein